MLQFNFRWTQDSLQRKEISLKTFLINDFFKFKLHRYTYNFKENKMINWILIKKALALTLNLSK